MQLTAKKIEKQQDILVEKVPEKKNSQKMEFLDLDMKYLEFKNNDLQRIVNGDLIFVHRDFRD